MRILIVGGAGFVGLNIAEQATGHEIVLFDRRPPPDAALRAFSGRQLTVVTGDVTSAGDVATAFTGGIDAVVYGAAITADSSRDAAEPERILAVNLGGLPVVMRAARDHGVRRVVNLSSAAALGRAVERHALLTEDIVPEPVSLYAITKAASERVLERLAALWSMDAINVRLSAVYGRWEHASGVRDTLSPHLQMVAAAASGRPARLARPGLRDWVYASDVGRAVVRLIEVPALRHRVYNVTTGAQTTALAFGESLANLRSGFDCRLAEAGEPVTIDLHSAVDRAPLSPRRLADDIGWSAAFDLGSATADLDAWARAHGASLLNAST